MTSRLAAAAALSIALFATGPPARAQIVPDRLHYQPYPHLEGKPVRQILVLGNQRTQEIVIRREMRLEEGLPFKSEYLWRDWERVVDLGLFAGVEVDAVASGEGVLVVVSVHERPWWFVAPVADYDFRDKKLTVGYRTRLRNLGGLNRTIRSDGRVGARDRFSLSWDTPWISGHRQSLLTGLDLELPRPDEDELRTNRVHMSTTRYIGDYKQTRQGITVFSRLELLSRDGTHPEGAVDELSPVIGAGWSRDRRNVRVDPRRGSLASVSGELVSSWSGDELGYGRGSIEGRWFLALSPRWVLASRFTTVLTTGEIPEYRRLGVGGADSIRGQRSDVERGNNTARASTELRFPILGRKRFTLPIPLVPKKISNVDLRVDGAVFVDAGTAWDDSVGLPTARVRPGAGLGLRVFLPIVEVARFELAFDPSGAARVYVAEGNVI